MGEAEPGRLEAPGDGRLRWVDAAGVEREIPDVRSLPFQPLARARRARVWPLRGGLNNGVFGVEADGRAYCLKLYADAGRDQATREWWALQRLWPLGLAPEPLGLAPEPLGYGVGSDVAPHGAILMELVRGEPLGERESGPALLRRLLPAVAAVHAVALPGGEPAWAAGGNPVPSSDGLRRWLDEALGAYGRARAAAAGQGVGRSEEVLLARLIEAARTLIERPLPPPPRLVLCRGDPSLSNVLVRPDGRLCLVDWEYSGRGDPAHEYAEYVHHPTSEGIPSADWRAALATYPPAREDPGFEARFALHDVLVGVWWCFRLARYLYDVAAGIERRPGKSDPAFVSATRERLSTRLRRAASA